MYQWPKPPIGKAADDEKRQDRGEDFWIRSRHTASIDHYGWVFVPVNGGGISVQISKNFNQFSGVDFTRHEEIACKLAA
jgi:hypothetical protein